MTQWLTSWDAELRRLFPTMTRQQLADHFGVHRSMINRQCERLGLQKGHRNPPQMVTVDLEDLQDMLLLGWSVRRISRETGATRKHIETLVQQLPRGMQQRAKRNWRNKT